jgi:hypothetical protein
VEAAAAAGGGGSGGGSALTLYMVVLSFTLRFTMPRIFVIVLPGCGGAVRLSGVHAEPQQVRPDAKVARTVCCCACSKQR